MLCCHAFNGPSSRFYITNKTLALVWLAGEQSNSRKPRAPTYDFSYNRSAFAFSLLRRGGGIRRQQEKSGGRR